MAPEKRMKFENLRSLSKLAPSSSVVYPASPSYLGPGPPLGGGIALNRLISVLIGVMRGLLLVMFFSSCLLNAIIYTRMAIIIFIIFKVAHDKQVQVATH